MGWDVDLGTRLKKLRTAKGLSQRELAEPRYTPAYVSTIEAGRRRPSRAALAHFAAKLAIDVDELVTGRPADWAARARLQLQEARLVLSAGRSAEAEKTLRRLAGEARRFGDQRLQAKVEEALGLWAERQGDADRALEHYERAEELLSDEAAPSRAEAVAGKARAHEALGDFGYAIYLLEGFLKVLETEKLRDPNALVRIYSSLVYAYFNAGFISKAETSARQALALAVQVSDPQRIAQMHMHVARVLLHQGKPLDAESALREAENIYRQLDLKTEMAGAHLALGYVCSREGRLDEAREHLHRAITVFEETQNKLDVARALNELARVERLEGHDREARELLERVLGLLEDGDVHERALAHREIALTYNSSDAQ
ncbi:MAG TPA: tetratricopeptide repeat protein, partial [Actinomycetota bacterium]|nr:tetratricopeptide repeat protein [Actinomycetota bacterium]